LFKLLLFDYNPTEKLHHMENDGIQKSSKNHPKSKKFQITVAFL